MKGCEKMNDLEFFIDIIIQLFTLLASIFLLLIILEVYRLIMEIRIMLSGKHAFEVSREELESKKE
jgi:hypothetical protein